MAEATNTKSNKAPGQRLTVFSVKKTESGGTIWTRAGTAFVNRDGSINVYLDVLPVDGKLHIREPSEKGDHAEQETVRQAS